MYTYASQFFSKDFKNTALSYIRNQIKEHVAMDSAMFGKMVAMGNGTEYGMYEVKERGYRWKDEEQVFQAMIMNLDDRLRKERGAGMMSEKEAASLEAMYKNYPYMFESLTRESVRQAANCDHWYMFEKQWD